jgi:hypothetical protein
MVTHYFLGTDLIIEEIKILSNDIRHLIIKMSNIIPDYTCLLLELKQKFKYFYII